jgi:hypothetical protein
MKLNQFLVASILCLALATCVIEGTEAQTDYSIEVQDYTWDHSDLSVLLVSQEGKSWWDPVFINLTLRAVGVWNDAFVDFATKYPNFGYLSNLRLAPTVSNNSSPGFDISVTWVEGTVTEGSDQVGLTWTFPDRQGVFVRSNITLSTQNRLVSLSDVEMQNIAQHEIGHSLGLLHSNYTGDIMYPTTSATFSVRSISTLDAYGVATVFGWMSISSSFDPSHKEEVPSPVSLPSNIEYENLAISAENLPPKGFFDPILDPIRNFLSAFFDYLLIPGRFMLFVLIMVALIIGMILYRFIRPTRNRQPSKNDTM